MSQDSCERSTDPSQKLLVHRPFCAHILILAKRLRQLEHQTNDFAQLEQLANDAAFLRQLRYVLDENEISTTQLWDCVKDPSQGRPQDSEGHIYYPRPDDETLAALETLQSDLRRQARRVAYLQSLLSDSMTYLQSSYLRGQSATSVDGIKLQWISQNYFRGAAYLAIIFLPGIFVSVSDDLCPAMRASS